MLLPNQFIEVKWHPANKKHYESKGYVYTKMHETFLVKAEDLLPTSHSRVKVKCDHCDKIMDRQFRRYVEETGGTYGDCCKKHSRLKAKETNMRLFGAEWALQKQEFKEKQMETCMKSYGVPYISQYDGFRQVVIESVRNRYGVDNVSQLPSVREKVAKSFYQNGTVATSKPQIELNNLLIKLYGQSELNYPLGSYLLDSYIKINGINIDVEYDGIYWHSLNPDKDRKRNQYVLSRGFKILRIVSADVLPEEEQLKQLIDTLVNTDETFIEIII